ncbi:MAG: hypothetical protein WBD50_08600 [Candidatus Rhabdochlamydia sp.]
MTSPVDNKPSQDPRWEQAQAERNTGHKHNSKARHHARRLLDAIGDRHAGAVVEESSKVVKEDVKSRRHYSNANRLENDALRARCKEYEVTCTIL